MTTDLPPPLIPTEVDIRGFSGFMLDVDRLLASELIALGSPEECWHALMLWCRAWQQHPAGSLPNDERILAAFSRAGSRWKKVRAIAMRGFVLCSDGRLYHPVLCEQVMAAWAKRKAYRNDQERLRKWRETRRENGPETPDEPSVKPVSMGVSDRVSEPDRRDRDRDREKKIPSSLRSDDGQPSLLDPKTVLWRDGLARVTALAGSSNPRKFLGKLADLAKQDHASLNDLISRCEAEKPSDPTSWLMAGARAIGGNGPSGPGASEPDDQFGLSAWIARQATERGTDQRTGQPIRCINGINLVAIGEQVLEVAAGAGAQFSPNPNWDALAGWCRDELPADDRFIPAIRRIASALRDPIRSLAVFDAAVRGNGRVAA